MFSQNKNYSLLVLSDHDPKENQKENMKIAFTIKVLCAIKTDVRFC